MIQTMAREYQYSSKKGINAANRRIKKSQKK
jgi:hypothetical protein